MEKPTLRSLGFTLVTLGALAGALAACGWLDARIYTACDLAFDCVSIAADKDATCKKNSDWATDDVQFLYNNDSYRSVIVTYELYLSYPREGKKNTLMSVMTTIPPEGRKPLGCVRRPLPIPEKYEVSSYTVIDACYADECPAKERLRPPVARAPEVTCQQICNENAPSCWKYHVNGDNAFDISVRDGLENLNDSLLNASSSQKVSLAALVALAKNAMKDCNRSDLDIKYAADGEASFLNTGTSCSIGSKLNNDTILQLWFPGTWLGQYKQHNHNIYELDPSDPYHAPFMYIIDKYKKKYYEPIVSVEGSSERKILFTGERYYCGQISWDPTD